MKIEAFVLNIHSSAAGSDTDQRIMDKHEEVLRRAFPKVPVVRDSYGNVSANSVLFLHIGKHADITEQALLASAPFSAVSSDMRKGIILSGLNPELANFHEAHGLGGAIVFQRSGVMMAYRPDIVDDHDQGEDLMHVFGNEDEAAAWFRIYFILLGEHLYPGT
jgi:hypothetical protein